MTDLRGKRALVTGGSRGLGLGIVEALVAKGAQVTAVARDAARLAAVKERIAIDVRAGDITDAAFAERALAEVKPDVLVLNAGATPPSGPIHEMSWEDFERPWQVDAKAAFHWVRAALRAPLANGSRVVLGSSGAAVKGSPMSGGYAGAKRMVWLLAQYANTTAGDLGLGIRFQAILPLQIMNTDLGRKGAETYAKRRGLPIEQFFASFGKPMGPAEVGAHVVSILTDPKYESGVAFGLKGDTGITSLDG